MYSKNFFLAVGVIALFLMSSQYLGSSLATTNSTKSTTTQKDQVFTTLTVTIVNATIYTDRASTGPGHIYYVIKIENNTYENGPIDINAPPTYTYTVNYTISQNITSATKFVQIEVWDKADILSGDLSTDRLGYFNITNLAVGTVEKNYPTYGATGGNTTDPQASLLVNTTVVQHNIFVPPVITLHTGEDINYTYGTTGHYLNFSIYDDNPYNYSIRHNNMLLFAADGWQNNAQIIFNIDGLGVGYSNYTILAFDTYSAYMLTTIWVNVTKPSGTGTYTGTGTDTSGTNASAGRTNRTIGADFAGPQYILLALAVVSIFVVRKKRKVL